MFNLTIPETIRNAVSDDDFRVYCRAEDEGPAELLVMDVIGEDVFGDGVSATGVVDFLRANASRDVNIRINSPGGLVYDGLVIFNALTQHSKAVTATIEGIAFSAASLIAVAADRIRMHEASDIGIHRAMMGAVGNRYVMQDAMEWLDGIDEHIIDIYTNRTGNDREKVIQWMEGTVDGTKFSAREAIDSGFADEMIEMKKRSSGGTESRRSQQANKMVRNYLAEKKLKLRKSS